MGRGSERTMTQPRLERGSFFSRTPCSLLVTGPSGCSETTFTRELLKHASHFMDPPPPSKQYCYGAWQPTFKMMQKEHATHFHDGIASLEELDAGFSPQGGRVLVLDNLMDEGEEIRMCWTYSQNIPTIRTSPYCICVKICFR